MTLTPKEKDIALRALKSLTVRLEGLMTSIRNQEAIERYSDEVAAATELIKKLEQ